MESTATSQDGAPMDTAMAELAICLGFGFEKSPNWTEGDRETRNGVIR